MDERTKSRWHKWVSAFHVIKSWINEWNFKKIHPVIFAALHQMNEPLFIVQQSNMAPMTYGILFGNGIWMQMYQVKKNYFWMRWHAAVNHGYWHVFLIKHWLKIPVYANRIWSVYLLPFQITQSVYQSHIHSFDRIGNALRTSEFKSIWMN